MGAACLSVKWGDTHGNALLFACLYIKYFLPFVALSRGEWSWWHNFNIRTWVQIFHNWCHTSSNISTQLHSFRRQCAWAHSQTLTHTKFLFFPAGVQWRRNTYCISSSRILTYLQTWLFTWSHPFFPSFSFSFPLSSSTATYPRLVGIWLSLLSSTTHEEPPTAIHLQT